MSTVVRVRRFTHDDVERMPQEREGDRHELIDGEIFVTPSPIPPHQLLLTEVSVLVNDAVRPGNLGHVFYAPTDVKPTPDDWVVPDLCFVARDRLWIVGASAIDGAPDLIVEILSPSTRGRDQAQKRALYERTGVREYWLVDPRDRTVTVFALRGGHYEALPLVGGRIRSELLPGAEIDVAALFTAAGL
jgi:Uma2 family endonuclease